MNTPKHTKGPWRVSTANDYSGIAIEQDAKSLTDRIPICEMEFDDTEPFESDIHDETKANASLIAASPELLAACQQALKVVSEIADIDTENRAGWAHKALQEAIDKATLPHNPNT